MISSEIIIDSRRKAKNGFPVKIRVYCSKLQKHRYVPTGLYRKSDKLKLDYDIAKVTTETEERVNYCNEFAMGLEESIKVIKEGIPKEKELEVFILQKRIEELQKESGLGLIEFLDIIVKEKISKGMSVKMYEYTKNQIENYIGVGKDVRLNALDYEWLNGFIHFKKVTGKGKGGIPQYLTTMRAVYKEAQRRKSLGIKKDNPFLGLIKKPKRRKNILYTVEHIKMLKDFEPKPGTTKKAYSIMKRNIDIFLFQLAIGGHDYIEIANLRWENINDRITFQRLKNDHREDGGETVNNMLSDFALYVLDKYGDKDSKRVFTFIPDPLENRDYYNNYNKVVGKSLARISESLGIPKLKTKSTRYIFRTFAGEIGVSDIVVMQIQGHRPDGETFNYQGFLSNSVIDKEHQKVLDLFF